MISFMGPSGITGPSSGRTSFEQLNQSQTQLEVKPGELWCIKENGEDWPVVICDEEIVQKFSKGKPRPANARRSNGTWTKESAGNKCYPALVLGILKIRWLGPKALQVFDDELGMVIRKSTTNPLLAKSWDEAMDCEQSNRDIGWWKQILLVKEKPLLRAENKQDAENDTEVHANDGRDEKKPNKKLGGSRKRKGTPEFKYPPGYARVEADDDEGGDLFLPLAEAAAGPKIKNEFSDSNSAEIDALYENPDSNYSRRVESNKRSKLGVAGHSTVPPQIPVRNDGRSRPSTPMALHRPGLTNLRATMTPFNPRSSPSSLAPDADKVMIYVGNPHKKFRARRSGLDASPLLSSLATYHPQNGWYLMSPLLSSLDSHDFFPVGRYIERGEYNPNILDEGNEWVRLEDDMTHQQHGQEVVRCGTIYSLAQTLQLPGLQDLAFRKLKALAKQESYHPLAILCVVDVVFESGDEDIRDYLVHYLADNYWNIVLAEAEKLAEVMQADRELSKGVFGLLSGVPPLKWTDAKIEDEQQVKDESKTGSTEEANQELTTPTSSTSTTQTFAYDEGKAEPGVEGKVDSGLEVIADLGLGGRPDSEVRGQAGSGLDQPAEPELVLTEEEKQWMREDDEAATEEVITKTTQQRSQFPHPS